MPQSKTKQFGGYGYAVGRKLKKPSNQVCQRCARRFKSKRLVPYCPKCFKVKRAERKSHGFGGGRP